MPLLSSLKAYALAGLSIALAVMYALFNREKAKRHMDKAKVAAGAAKTLTKANEAISEADKRGKERLREDGSDPRDHFS